MRHNDVIYLISIEVVEDEIGNQIPQEKERLVYANQMAVTQSEFYNAATTGLKPAKQFEVYSFEYQGEEKLRHNNTICRIIRAETRGDKTRLVCEMVISDG